MKIMVNNRDYGFLSSKPITVYRVESTDDPTIAWCNHDGADIETVEDPFGHESLIEICDKCDATKYVRAEDEWQNAPFEGEL